MRQNKKLNSDTKSTLITIATFIEIITLSLIYYTFWRIGYDNANFPPYLGKGKFVLIGLYAFLCWLFINNADGFEFGNLRKADLAFAQWIGLFIANFITYIQLCLIANHIISIWPVLLLMISEVVVSIIFIFVYSAAYRRIYAPHNMLLVYGSDNAVVMKIKMDTRKEKYRVNRLIPADCGFKRICAEILEHDYDSVVINDVSAELRNDILKFCYQHSIRAYVIPKITDIIIRGGEPVSAFDTPMLMVKGTGLTIGNRILKRAMDIILCLIAMIIAAPVMLIVAAAIKLEDGGPVFYKQKRATLNGKEFDILKFRSMIVDAEKEGHSIPATGKDPRITKVGNIIRGIRIDELPQILNIFKGDMSIVGPRPERLEHVEQYSKDIPEFSYRLKVKGGLTGYAQIYGKYNTSAYDKLRLDLMYIENYSILLDIKLIIMTVRILLSKESTEGFEKAEELEHLKQELLDQEKDPVAP